MILEQSAREHEPPARGSITQISDCIRNLTKAPNLGAEVTRLEGLLAEARSSRDELGDSLLAALGQLCGINARAVRAERVIHALLRAEPRRAVLDNVKLSAFGNVGEK